MWLWYQPDMGIWCVFIPSLSWAGIVYRMVTYCIKELLPPYCPFFMFLSKQPENLSKVKSFSRPDASAPVTQDTLQGPHHSGFPSGSLTLRINVLRACVCVPCVCLVPKEVRSPGTAVKDGCEPPCRCWAWTQVLCENKCCLALSPLQSSFLCVIIRFFLFLKFYIYRCFVGGHVCVPHACSAHEARRRHQIPLGLELKTVLAALC